MILEDIIISDLGNSFPEHINYVCKFKKVTYVTYDFGSKKSDLVGYVTCMRKEGNLIKANLHIHSDMFDKYRFCVCNLAVKIIDNVLYVEGIGINAPFYR